MQVPVPYRDRAHAGVFLSEALSAYQSHKNVVVIALPRGGVPVAYEVAKRLHFPLDITYPCKIGAPGNPEFAIGAVTEEGQGVFHEDVIASLGVSQDFLKKVMEEKKEQAQKRLKLYRSGKSPLDVDGKIVLLVDDGVATGATMEAAIKSLRSLSVQKIVVVVPVGPPDSIAKLESIADEIVCLSTPQSFYSVGQFYEEFGQTSDEEVISLMCAAMM